MTQYTRTHMQTNPFRTEEATFWLLVYMIVSVRLLVRHHIRYWYICNSINMLNYDNIENLSLCDRLYPSRDRKIYMKINQFEVMIIQKLGWMNKNFTDYHSEAICPIHIIPLSLLSCIDKYRRVFCYNPACVRITVLHPPPNRDKFYFHVDSEKLILILTPIVHTISIFTVSQCHPPIPYTALHCIQVFMS